MPRPAGEDVQRRRQFWLRVFPDEPAPRPALQRKNLSVPAGARVSKVRMQNRQAVAIESTQGRTAAVCPKPKAPGDLETNWAVPHLTVHQGEQIHETDRPV